MEKELSCGFIVVNAKNREETLACIGYGHKFGYGMCDIPKGHKEGDETPLEAAKRELKEETGIELTNEHIVDYGEFLYLRTKDLHVYLVEMDLDLDKLHCDSTFIDKNSGNVVPEMIGYKWVSDVKYYYHSLQSIVESCLKDYNW